MLAVVGFAAGSAHGAELGDNLSGVTSGTESATVNRHLAAAFRTDASATYRLSSVTLLVANTNPGTAALDLHSDGGLEPGTRVATLIPPESYSNAPAATTFAADDLTLDGSATYWVVLRPLSGTFDWAWTADNTGSGVGFDPTWDVSEDAGSVWYTHDVYPLQLRVTVATTDPTPERAFVRGDCNDDGGVDISDAVSTLGALFLGQGEITCQDACDSNDDGTVDVSDAIATLGVLFLGNGVIPLPGMNECGIDPTEDDVGCETQPKSCG